MKDLQAHPAAELLPPMTSEEYAELLADIKANGVREPIVILKGDGRLLDGRHRYRAAKEAGVECPRREVETDSPASYALSTIRRRNLSTSQRSMIAAKAMAMIEEEAKQRQVSGLKTGPTAREPVSANLRSRGKSSAEAAKMTGVSARSVESAKAVIRKAPQLAAKVESGEMTLNAAKRQIRKAPTKSPKADAKEASGRTDALGRPITSDEVAADFAEADRFKELVNEVHALKRKVKALAATRLGSEIVNQDCEMHFSAIVNRLKSAAPHAVCKCGGVKKCQWCQGKGWMPESVWNRVPKEDRA